MKKTFYIFLIIILLFNINNLGSELFDKIFVIINEDVITLNEFKKNFLKLKEGLLRLGKPLPPDARKIIFNGLISEKIIQQVAEKKEVFVSDNEIEEAIERIKKINRLSDTTFEQALAQEGKTLKDLEAEYRKQILNERIMNLELRPNIVPATDEEIKDYYQKNKKQMYSPEKIKVSHILIRINLKDSLSEQTRIKRKTGNILKRAINRENFTKLAEKYSDDTVSAPLGGNIGWISPDEWLPEIDHIIFKLKKGQIAKTLLQSRQGWHIVKVTDKKLKKLIPFSKMRPNLENFLIQQKMQKEYEKWLEEQKRNAYFEVIFPGDEKYIYDFDKWQKKNTKKFISNEEFFEKLKSIKIDK